MVEETSGEELVAAIKNAAGNLRVIRNGERVIVTGVASDGIA